ncbi:MAG: hypothetical protein HRT35_26310 [Algicola sp.]|nr:hypothetical protein [Algicola sp.]
MTTFSTKLCAVGLLSLTLSACGGSSNSTPPLPANVAPVANAGPDQTVDEQTSVTLAGSGTDTDGNIATFSWAQTAGTAVTLTGADTPTPSFTALDINADMLMTFQLTVTDNEGATAVDDVNVNVNHINLNPVANAGADQNILDLSDVTLSGSGSDEDGSIVSYQWSQLTGTPVSLADANAAIATFTMPVISTTETLSFELTVTDNLGATASDLVDLVVTSGALANLSFSDSNLQQCFNQYASDNNFTHVTEMHTLICIDKNIKNITGVEHLTSLRVLDLSRNLIFDVNPMSNLTGLVWLNLYGNLEFGLGGRGDGLEDITPLAGLVALKNFNITENEISDLTPIENMTALVTLSIGYNPITDISVLSNLTQLKQFDVSKLQLTSLETIGQLTQLTRLTLNGNPTPDLTPLAALTVLEDLSISSLQVTDLSPLANLTAINKLNISFNQNLVDISPLAGLTNLAILGLHSNDIVSLSPLSNLTKLTYLEASFNDINDISGLSQLVDMSHLLLRHNDISDISALFNLVNATYVDISNNDRISCEDSNALVATLGEGIVINGACL